MAEEKKLILPFDDGEMVEDEAIEKCEEHQEEVRDALEDAVETVEEINGDEHIEAIPEKIKPLTNEKLILKEPEDSLNESLNESELEEAIPRELAKAYNNARSRIGGAISRYGYGDIGGKKDNAGRRVTVDFQNSDYTEITPAEALALKKQGRAEDVRAIFDGQLVTFNDKGWQSTGNYSAERSWKSDAEKYRKKSGKLVDKSNGLTFEEVVTRADKVYVVNEKPVDYNIRDQRAQNPESPYTKITRDDNNLLGKRNDRGKTNYYSWETIDSLEKDIAAYKKQVQDWTTARDNSNSQYEKDTYQAKIDSVNRDIKTAQLKLNKLKDRAKYLSARQRYLASEIDLMEPFDKLKALKSDVYNAQRDLRYANDNYNSIKNNGTSDARWYKQELANCNKRLEQLMRDIAKYEIYLQDEDEKSAAELAKAADDITASQTKLNDIQAEIDKLLRRGN